MLLSVSRSVFMIVIEKHDPRDAKFSLEPMAISSREIFEDQKSCMMIDLRAIIPRL